MRMTFLWNLWRSACVVAATLVPGVADAQTPLDAVLIKAEADGRVVVSRFLSPEAPLAKGQRGLAVWREGEKERWRVVAGPWSLPTAGADASDRLSESTRSLGNSSGGADLDLLTSRLDQIRGGTLIRDGGLLTPTNNGQLLFGTISVIRKPAKDGKELPAAVAVISQGDKEVAKLPLDSKQQAVHWRDVPNVAKDGLPPGRYTLQMRPGTERVTFTVQPADVRKAVSRRFEELGVVLGSKNDALAVRVLVEELLNQTDAEGRPLAYAADALAAIDSVPEMVQPVHFRKLREFVVKRLEDPSQQPEPAGSLGTPTGLVEIDRIRDLIAAGQWADAGKRLDAIKGDDTRLRGYEALYKGVIFAESGQGAEEQAIAAFSNAAELLSGGSAEDRFRVHSNLGSFLLNRVQDQLYNSAFQIATGARHPVTDAILSWEVARLHFERAREASVKLPPAEQAAATANLARTYVVLADAIRTLSHPSDATQQLPEAEKAAAETARKLGESLAKDVRSDSVVAAATGEMLAHLSFRQGDMAASRKSATDAMRYYMEAGSLTGIESVQRLLGLITRKDETAAPADKKATLRDQALKHFLISHHLSELLRERFPTETSGRSRAGFFARRAYVNEQIIELHIAANRPQDALRFAELAKARAMQDVLAARRKADRDAAEPVPMDEWLAKWPKGVAAVEYFLGSENAFVFVIAGGKVTARRLTDADDKPIAPSSLVAKIRTYLDGVESQAGKMHRRLVSGSGLDHTWQDDLHYFFQVLFPADTLAELRKAKSVIVVPHHILHYLPFAALVTERDPKVKEPLRMLQPKFLVDEPFHIATVPSLSMWALVSQQPPRAIQDASAIGIVDFPGAPRLPGVDVDLQNIKDALKSRVRTVHRGETADEANVKAVLRKPGAVLVATHGINFADRPLTSFLMLQKSGSDDGRLTAAELFELTIEADLVVMGACYSGLADRSPLPGDDLFGLQRALLQSGARAVVSGLWDVYDGAAPELLKGFFTRMADGQDAPLALAESQRAFLKSRRSTNSNDNPEFWLHPYFWAVYQYSGDPRVRMAK